MPASLPRTRNIVALGAFALFYLAFGVFLTVRQESVIYLPGPQDFSVCAELGNAETVVHNGTRMYVERGERGIVVLYHGNAGSACDRAWYAEMFREAGYGFVLPEYAGYSNDVRKTTHDLVKRDVENVVAYLRQERFGKVLLIGESIGTGPASYHTSLAPPDALMLISPFTTLPDVARSQFWFYPTSLLVVNAFDNVALLKEYRGPVVILHGESDQVIPYALGRALFEAVPSKKKQFISIAGHGHNDLFIASEAAGALQDFLDVSH